MEFSMKNKWQLDGSSVKKLLFIESPPMPTDVNTRIFREMGFEVRVHQFFYPDLQISTIKNEFQPLDFDIVLVCISGDASLAEETIVSEAFLNGLGQLGQGAKKTSIVGMNLALSGKKQAKQAKIFDNLFIGGDTTDEQIRDMFRNLIAR
jgi:hypothetical protein